MCIQQGHSFLINTIKPPSTTCSATTSNKIHLEQVVTFEVADVGTKIYPEWIVDIPGYPGQTYTAIPYTIAGATTETFSYEIITKPVGTYTIQKSYVAYLGFPLCTPSTFVYGCGNLTLTQPCTTPSCGFVLT